jgi:hypothetical protein
MKNLKDRILHLKTESNNSVEIIHEYKCANIKGGNTCDGYSSSNCSALTACNNYVDCSGKYKTKSTIQNSIL